MKIFWRKSEQETLTEDEVRTLINYAYMLGEAEGASEDVEKSFKTILKKHFSGEGYIPGCILEAAAEQLKIKLDRGLDDIEIWRT